MPAAVPVIDIAPWLAGDPAGGAAAAAQVDRALQDVGFFLITGHGVPAGLRAEVRAQHLLHDRLRDLLARLGEPLVPAGDQPERTVEVGDAAPGQ